MPPTQLDRSRQPDDVSPQAPHPLPRSVLFALLWSIATAVTAISWALDLLPHPFGDADQIAIGAVFNTSDPLIGTAFTLVVALAGVACALVMRRTWHGPAAVVPSAPLLAAWGIVAALTLVLLHGSLLAFLGYTVVLPFLAWFEPALLPAFVAAVTRPDTIFQLTATLGAVLWGNAALRYRRAERAACVTCGRTPGWSVTDEARTRSRALRTGQVASWVAAGGLLIYPAMRIPWLFGIRIGVDAETWAQLQEEGVEAGIALGLAGLVGAVLIAGLVRDWGVHVPRWMLGLAGRRVPIAAAVAPAIVVTIGFVALGRGTLMGALTGALGGRGGGVASGADVGMHVVAFGALLPAGVALAVAAAAYAVRRRAECRVCGQGTVDVAVRDLRTAAVTGRP
ncbi:hypothetical protein [Nitriliruptor alkaliphilus]|uniref:hypothetical protein n=1 Tax=Nitriliruptor alkaliphilus TaxID=427918 RepID=UPI0006973627|nr:hypothetical protein [Nitriliruptor alkaliphilus]